MGGPRLLLGLAVLCASAPSVRAGRFRGTDEGALAPARTARLIGENGDFVGAQQCTQELLRLERLAREDNLDQAALVASVKRACDDDVGAVAASARVRPSRHAVLEKLCGELPGVYRPNGFNNLGNAMNLCGAMADFIESGGDKSMAARLAPKGACCGSQEEADRMAALDAEIALVQKQLTQMWDLKRRAETSWARLELDEDVARLTEHLKQARAAREWEQRELSAEFAERMSGDAAEQQPLNVSRAVELVKSKSRHRVASLRVKLHNAQLLRLRLQADPKTRGGAEEQAALRRARAAEVELTMAEHADRSQTMAAVVEGEVAVLQQQLDLMEKGEHTDVVGAAALRAKKGHLQQLMRRLEQDAAAPDNARMRLLRARQDAAAHPTDPARQLVVRRLAKAVQMAEAETGKELAALEGGTVCAPCIARMVGVMESAMVQGLADSSLGQYMEAFCMQSLELAPPKAGVRPHNETCAAMRLAVSRNFVDRQQSDEDDGTTAVVEFCRQTGGCDDSLDAAPTAAAAPALAGPRDHCEQCASEVIGAVPVMLHTNASSSRTEALVDVCRERLKPRWTTHEDIINSTCSEAVFQLRLGVGMEKDPDTVRELYIKQLQRADADDPEALAVQELKQSFGLCEVMGECSEKQFKATVRQITSGDFTRARLLTQQAAQIKAAAAAAQRKASAEGAARAAEADAAEAQTAAAKIKGQLAERGAERGRVKQLALQHEREVSELEERVAALRRSLQSAENAKTAKEWMRESAREEQRKREQDFEVVLGANKAKAGMAREAADDELTRQLGAINRQVMELRMRALASPGMSEAVLSAAVRGLAADSKEALAVNEAAHAHIESTVLVEGHAEHRAATEANAALQAELSAQLRANDGQLHELTQLLADAVQKLARAEAAAAANNKELQALQQVMGEQALRASAAESQATAALAKQQAAENTLFAVEGVRSPAARKREPVRLGLMLAGVDAPELTEFNRRKLLSVFAAQLGVELAYLSLAHVHSPAPHSVQFQLHIDKDAARRPDAVRAAVQALLDDGTLLGALREAGFTGFHGGRDVSVMLVGLSAAQWPQTSAVSELDVGACSIHVLSLLQRSGAAAPAGGAAFVYKHAANGTAAARPAARAAYDFGGQSLQQKLEAHCMALLAGRVAWATADTQVELKKNCHEAAAAAAAAEAEEQARAKDAALPPSIQRKGPLFRAEDFCSALNSFLPHHVRRSSDAPRLDDLPQAQIGLHYKSGRDQLDEPRRLIVATPREAVARMAQQYAENYAFTVKKLEEQVKSAAAANAAAAAGNTTKEERASSSGTPSGAEELHFASDGDGSADSAAPESGAHTPEGGGRGSGEAAAEAAKGANQAPGVAPPSKAETGQLLKELQLVCDAGLLPQEECSRRRTYLSSAASEEEAAEAATEAAPAGGSGSGLPPANGRIPPGHPLLARGEAGSGATNERCGAVRAECEQCEKYGVKETCAHLASACSRACEGTKAGSAACEGARASFEDETRYLVSQFCTAPAKAREVTRDCPAQAHCDECLSPAQREKVMVNGQTFLKGKVVEVNVCLSCQADFVLTDLNPQDRTGTCVEAAAA